MVQFYLPDVVNYLHSLDASELNASSSSDPLLAYERVIVMLASLQNTNSSGFSSRGRGLATRSRGFRGFGGRSSHFQSYQDRSIRCHDCGHEEHLAGHLRCRRPSFKALRRRDPVKNVSNSPWKPMLAKSFESSDVGDETSVTPLSTATPGFQGGVCS